MKIAFITGSYPPIECGVGDYTTWVARLLKKDSHSISVITSVEVPKDDITLPIIEKWNFSCILPIIKSISKIRPEVIHLQYPTKPYGRKIAINLLPLILRIRFPRTPLVVTAHEYHDASRLGKIRIIGTLLFASKIILTNNESFSPLKKVMPWRAFSLIPIASNIPVAEVGPSGVEEIQKKYGLVGSFVLSYFGFIDTSKGIEKLLNAARSFPSDIRLLLVTSYDPSNEYHQILKQEVASLNERVSWTGFVSENEVSAILQSSDGCIFPFDAPASLRRSSLITALVHGLPTITTGPVSEPLLDRINCLVMPDNTPESITKAVSVLFNEPELRKIVRVNTELLGKSFDRKTITIQHEKLYASLVS